MPHYVVPNWLGADSAAQLLSYACDNERRFVTSRVGAGDGTVEASLRRSLLLADLGPFADMLKRRALDQQPDLERALGMQPVPLGEVELELVAHGDGAFYGPHIDTSTGADSVRSAQRRFSLIYYFHRMPRRFAGGRLRLLRLGAGPAVEIEPVHDRLVAFPSFAPHEVEPVACPGCSFIDSRFSVNIWLYARQRATR